MKKYVIALIVLICIVIIMVFTYLSRVEIAEAPDRPNTVPMSAVWKGDFDEGFWLDLISSDTLTNEYRFKIYKDTNGELAFDGIFRPYVDCNLIKVHDDLNNVLFFDFTNEYSLILVDNCTLKAILPAFGGSLWEVEKQNIK